MSDRGVQDDSRDGSTADLEVRNATLKRASEILSRSNQTVTSQLNDLLAVVRDAIGTAGATFSHVDGDAYRLEAVDVTSEFELEAGETLPLSAVPTCERVLETGQTLAVSDIDSDASELADSPQNLACYLGTPVFDGSELYGTFCVYGTKPRANGFSEWDVTIVELLGNWVGDRLERTERGSPLRDAELQVESGVKAGAIGTWEWHIPDDTFVTGPSFARTFGVDPDTAREGATLERFVSSIHEEDRERIEQKIEAAVESGGEYEAEYRVWNEHDELRWVIARGHVECDEDGNPLTFPGALTDITSRKRTERELERLNSHLETSNERLEQFAYAASHDLQEPLRMVSSYLQLLERRHGDALDEEAGEFLEFAVDGADRMRHMIDGLLEYSRIDARGNPFEPVDLNEVLDDVEELLRREITASSAEIDIDSLPTIDGDATQLKQLFRNVLENALTFSGADSPRIDVSAERRDSQHVVAVRDEGIGIDPAEHEHIFEVFQRLHSHGEFSGSGIGLALCQRVVERHDGEMWVESEPGEGSTFFVALPTTHV